MTATPVILIMENSIHISSSGSLASIDKLTIPISKEESLKKSSETFAAGSQTPTKNSLLSQPSDLNSKTYLAGSIKKTNVPYNGSLNKSHIVAYNKSNTNWETKKSLSISRSDSTKDKLSNSKFMNGSSGRDGMKSLSRSNSRVNSAGNLSRRPYLMKGKGERSKSGTNDSQDKQSDSSDSDSLASRGRSLSSGSSLSLNDLLTYSQDKTTQKKNPKRKKQKSKLILKLTNSEMELLGEKTGQFTGAHDKYRRFLSGDANLKKNHQRPSWELTVGLPFVAEKRGKGKYDMPSIMSLKKKSQRLEELRIFQEENTLLAKLHEKYYSEMNRKVSKITSDIAKLDQQLVGIVKERRAFKKGVAQDWEAFEKKLDWQASKVQKAVKEKEYQYEEACNELIDLQYFKDLTLQGSEAVESKKHQAQIKKQEMLLQNEKEMEQLNARIKAEDLETSNKLYHQIGGIIDNAQLVMKNMVDKKTLAVYRKNHKLKLEIQVHSRAHERNEVSLKELGDLNARLKLDLANSLKKTKTICTPDMEFNFSFQQKA